MDEMKMWAIVNASRRPLCLGDDKDDAWEEFLKGKPVRAIRQNTEADWNANGYRAIRVTVTPDEPEKPKRKKKEPPSSIGRSGHSTGNGPGCGLDYATSY